MKPPKINNKNSKIKNEAISNILKRAIDGCIINNISVEDHFKKIDKNEFAKWVECEVKFLKIFK